MTSKLPSFDTPPVIEVAMGVQFQRLGTLLAPHLGKFWATVEDEYPNCRENPPIIPQIEDFTQAGSLRRGQIELTDSPDLPRIFLEDATGQWLIQIQRDRFLHNWRQGTDGVAYPRYPAVSRRFFQQWKSFQSFVNQHNLGPVQVVQLEITYLNNIPVQSSRLGDVFPDFQWRGSERVLPRPESCAIYCSFTGDRKLKRLRANVQPILHEGRQQLRFELTVRGVQQETESFEAWFDDGRAWIVTAFADLTSPEWHVRWGKKA